MHPYMMNSLGWQTVVATPPITTQGLSTVCPPVTEVPASSDASLKPWMISGMTLSLSCKDPGISEAESTTGYHSSVLGGTPVHTETGIYLSLLYEFFIYCKICYYCKQCFGVWCSRTLD